MTTDIHTHLGTSPNEVYDVDADNMEEQVDMLISRMDTFGIDKAVLVPDEPRIKTTLYVKAAEIYPDRLFSACSIIPRPIDTANKKLLEYIDLGCKAVELSDETFHPRDPAAQALIKAAVNKNMPIYLKIDNLTSDYIMFLDTITTVYPEGKFVILNMGGLFGFPQLITLTARPNLWLELSTTFIKLVESPLRVFLDSIVQDIGVRKLVFGSGYHSQYVDMMAALNLIDLNIETSRLVLKENAWLILGVDFS
ncbi:MAG: amidohydrolase family protein [Candidatus Thorarchaeota archaeon]|nr:amidohydrolase family protein [Candidatus Thorarchaeota archaeon]